MTDSTIKISADTQNLINALRIITEQISHVGSVIKAQSATFAASFDDMANRTSGAGSALTGDFKKVVDAINKTTEASKNMSKVFIAESQRQSFSLNDHTQAINDMAEVHSSASEKIRKILKKQKKELREVNNELAKQTPILQKNGRAWTQILNGAYYQVIPQILKGVRLLTRGAYESVAGFEKASVALSAFTGSMESAKAKFWELNTLEDKTCQSTDKLANAFVILGKYGLDNSSKALTSYSQIAVAMNKTVEEVANAIGNASQGQFKSLKELGIQAKQEGDQIILTYQGVTTAIGANTGELEKYIQKLSDDNFSGILEEKTKTVEGAMNRMKNAWGTLQTVLFNADTPFGKFFVNGLNEISSFINDAINIIQTPEIQQVFTEVCNTLKDTAQSLLDGLASITDIFLSENCDTWQKRWTEIGEIVSTWLNYIEQGLVSLIGVAKMVATAFKRLIIDPWMHLPQLWDNLSNADGIGGMWDAITSYQAQHLVGIEQGFDDILNIADNTGDKIIQIRDRLDKDRQNRKDASLGFTDNTVNYRTWETPQETAPVSKPIGTAIARSRKSGGSRSGRAQEARDTWTPYYQQLKELDMKSKSDLEKLEWEHAKKLQEYQKIIAENTQASETEKANALLIINTAYQEDRKKIEKEAHDFIRSLDPEDAELMRLEEGYRKKLEQLEQFHEDQLVSEQTFLEKREELRTQFEQEKKDFQKKKDSEKNNFFSKEDLENIKLFQGGMNDLSDAFSNLTEGMSKSSAAYKAMFALQKGFAVASATMNAIVAWTKALSAPDNVSWYQSLANYASAVALTTGIIQQLTSVSMHDKGGKINPGEWGIVGEYGPELIQGPASVTSRRETADLVRSAMSGGDVIVNLYESNDKAGSVESEDDHDTRIINIFVSDIRRGGEMSDAIQNTFNLKRIGA